MGPNLRSTEWSPARRRAVALYAALLGWAAGILWLSSLTPDEMPDQAFLMSDKVYHVLAFTMGGWLAASAIRVSRPTVPAGRSLTAAVALIGAFGVLDETIQTLTPGRTGGDLRDWVADVLGAVLGALLSLATGRRICRNGLKAGEIAQS